MIQRFPIRNLCDSLENSKLERVKEKLKNSEDIKHSLEHLTECVIQMTKQMKEMRKDNQKLTDRMLELNLDERKIGKQEIHQHASLASRMEKRFQNIDLGIPTIAKEDNQEQREQIIFGWITDLSKAVFSIGFSLYESGVLDINKVKAYCSENLIRNFIKFCKKNILTPEEIGKINDFLVDDLLPYFCLKYPESEEAETSAKFSSGLIERDDLGNNDYDLVYKSGVDFSYQESGNYNSQIMKFLNYIISLTEKNVPVKYSPGSKEKDKEKEKGKNPDKKPLNKLFVEDMESIFRMVEIEENTLQMQMFDPKNPEKTKKQPPNTEISHPKKENRSEEQDEMEKQKKKKEKEYREKVILYTSFQIGQKLSKNLKMFSNSDMDSGNLTLSSSDIIRVLTKWAEELEQCFKKEYFQERDAPFRMKNGSQRYLNSTQTREITKAFSREKQNIEIIKQEIRQNNNRNQSMLMGQETYQRLVRLSEDEASVGQFASSIFKNNITYLISYLNALIHGIHQSTRKSYNLESQRTPQLITFSIGDLMRCKCSSKENEIIALYKEIERRHRQPDSGIKIIRVKNRLNRGNKDILMNLLYRGEMVVEMQLVIKSDKSKFIECSYNFNHYLYELKRAQFGPIMEMCNVWMNKDSKGKFYLEKMEKLNVRNKKKVLQSRGDLQKKLQNCCMKNKKQMKLPFRCSSCACFFSASSLLENNIECKECKTFTCYLCQLEVLDVKKQMLLQQIPEMKAQEVVSYQNIENDSGGVLVDLKSRQRKPVVFITSEYKKKFYMFEYDKIKKDVNLVQKFQSRKVPASFLKQHLLLTTTLIGQKVKNLDKIYGSARQKYFTREYLKEAYKTEKASISLKKQELSKQMLEIKDIQNWPHIVKINFSDNKNMNLQKIMEKFPNVEVAVLNYSEFQLVSSESSILQAGQDGEKTAIMTESNHSKKSHRQFEYLKHLKQLQMQGIKMQEFPQYLCYAKQLQKLNLNQNKLTKLPQSINELQNLQILYLESNSLQSVPENFGKMKSLQKLYIQFNQFKQIPASLCDLPQLAQLSLVKNKIDALPDQIGNLKKLKILTVSSNMIKSISPSISKLRQLQVLKLSQNQLETLPQNFGELPNLQSLNLNNNKLKSLPQNFGNLTKLQILYLQKNQLRSLPQQFGNLTSLQKLYLFSNRLEQLPQSFGNLVSLQIFHILMNLLRLLPQSFGNLSNLQDLHLEKNRLKSLPQNFGNLANLQYLHLEKNQLKQLPQQFGNLGSLKKLYLDSNQLQSLPQNFGNLGNLQYLQLQGNKLKSLPEQFGNLVSLQQLDLRKNQLKSLPLQFDNLVNLYKLILRGNQLTSLPHEIWRLPKLSILHLDQNKLESLPEFIGDQLNLRILNLSKNELKQLPSSMSLLKQLQYLDIRENKLTKLPKKILKNLPTLKQLKIQQNQLTEIPSQLFTLSKFNKLCFSVFVDLTFPTNLAELRSTSEEKLQIQIEYFQEYQKLVQLIQKQSTDKIEIQARKIKKREAVKN